MHTTFKTLLSALFLLAAAYLPAQATAGVPPLNQPSSAYVLEVKLGLDSLSKADRTKFWERVDAYASIDAVQQFCGKNLNLVRRTWSVVSPCIDLPSLRRVRSVFLSKRTKYLKGWETAYTDPEKKKAACMTLKVRLDEWSKLLNTHIAEASSLCSACIFC